MKKKQKPNPVLIMRKLLNKTPPKQKKPLQNGKASHWLTTLT